MTESCHDSQTYLYAIPIMVERIGTCQFGPLWKVQIVNKRRMLPGLHRPARGPLQGGDSI